MWSFWKLIWMRYIFASWSGFVKRLFISLWSYTRRWTDTNWFGFAARATKDDWIGGHCCCGMCPMRWFWMISSLHSLYDIHMHVSRHRSSFPGRVLIFRLVCVGIGSPLFSFTWKARWSQGSVEQTRRSWGTRFKSFCKFIIHCRLGFEMLFSLPQVLVICFHTPGICIWSFWIHNI